MEQQTPFPLSFPAVLRNPKLTDRFAHLHVSPQDSPPPSHQHAPKKDRLDLEGKRWVRRRENARFTHNPHITLPTTVDFTHPLQVPSSTFPHPLPSYLPRSLPVPPSRPPPSLPHTSIAGLFSLSLRGARRALRARPSSPYLVRAIETHLVAWLQGGTYLNPDQTKGLLRFPGDPVGSREDIRELAREAGKLVWIVKVDSGPHDGGFERYVVHCVARWYGVVSFSKETDGHRLTYLLRPNVTRPDLRVNAASRPLDTPPTTDASDFHVSDVSLSDFDTTDASDHDSIDASDINSGSVPTGTHSLTDIEESRPSSPASWSIFGESDFVINSDDEPDDHGFVASMESLSLSTHAELDNLAVPLTPSCHRDVINNTEAVSSANGELEERSGNSTPSRARVDRDRLRTLYPRSTSSPSPARRSPHRLPKLTARRKRKVKDKKCFAGALGTDKGTFYDYLFA